MKQQMIPKKEIGAPKDKFFMPGVKKNNSGILVDEPKIILDNGSTLNNSVMESKKIADRIAEYNASLNTIDSKIDKITNCNSFIVRMYTRQPYSMGENVLLGLDQKYIPNLHSSTGRPDGDPILCPLQYSNIGVIQVVPENETMFKKGDIVQVYNTHYESIRYNAINDSAILEHDTFYYLPDIGRKRYAVSALVGHEDYGYVKLKQFEIVCKIGSIYDN